MTRRASMIKKKLDDSTARRAATLLLLFKYLITKNTLAHKTHGTNLNVTLRDTARRVLHTTARSVAYYPLDILQCRFDLWRHREHPR